LGIDVISWFGGSLQSQMGEEGWLELMKLRAYKAAAEEAAPDDPGRVVLEIPRRDGTSASVPHGDLVAALDSAAREAGDCAPCFEEDSPCHRFISFPIDEMAERILFNYFLRELETPDSPGDQIYRDFIESSASVGPSWEKRGAGDASTLASSEPFVETIASRGGVTITSSQVLGALLRDERGVESVTGRRRVAVGRCRSTRSPTQATTRIHAAW